MYGQVVNVDDYNRIKIFCPDLIYVDFVPGYGDDYIIDVKSLPLKTFRERFQRSVLISPFGVDLTKRDKVMDLVHEQRPIPEKARAYFTSLPEPDFWNNIAIFKVCGKYKREEESESLYPLLRILGGSRSEMLAEISKVAMSHSVYVMFSTMMTFLLKIKNVAKLKLNPKYRDDLIKAKGRLQNVDVKKAIVKFLKSERILSDFINFMLSLQYRYKG